MTDLAPPLAPGDLMPDLTLTAPDGSPGSLHEVRAGRAAVVYFMRTSTCPVCHRHVAELVRLAESGRVGDRAVLVLAPGGAGEAAEVRRRVPSSAVEVRATGDGHAAAGFGRFLALQHSGVMALDAEGVVEYRRSAAVPLQSFDAAELLATISA